MDKPIPEGVLDRACAAYAETEVKLSERLEALLGRMTNGHVIALQCMEFIRDHGPALAELARRVEGAPVAVVECNDAKGAWLVTVDDAPLYKGQRARIVPNSPTPPDPGHEQDR